MRAVPGWDRASAPYRRPDYAHAVAQRRILTPDRRLRVFVSSQPRRPSSASADDFPVPDMPVTRILDIATTLPIGRHGHRRRGSVGRPAPE
jgi:hypothetical protein